MKRGDGDARWDRVSRRVVVTGVGGVTPLGTGVQKSWDALLKGISGVRKLEHFDASQHTCQIAAEVRDFDPLDFVERKESKRTDRFTQFALACATMAVEDAGLSISNGNGDRAGWRGEKLPRSSDWAPGLSSRCQDAIPKHSSVPLHSQIC